MNTGAVRMGQRELNGLEHVLDDYDGQRARASPARPSVESLLDTLDSGVYTSSTQRSARLQTSTVEYSTSTKTASRDLDDLMTSLSDFKLKVPIEPVSSPATTNGNGGGDARYARPQKTSNQLDSILGSLEADMSKHGISTIPKGDCAGCQKAIIGQVVIALGKMWHPEHFVCAHCGEELGHKNFFERSQKAFCEMDYHNLFSPRCAYCNGPIKDKCVTALDKTWHPEHFFCAQCGRDFGTEGFHERDGKALCRQDFYSQYAPKCRGCEKAIVNNYITALDAQWHPECFICMDCGKSFNGGSFFDHNGRPYCETHYHEKRGSLCANCQKPISGRCVTAMAKRFHPEHFVCSFCLRQLNKGTFKEHQNKPYCHQCFAKLLS